MYANDLKLFGLATSKLPSSYEELRKAYRRKIEEIKSLQPSRDQDEVRRRSQKRLMLRAGRTLGAASQIAALGEGSCVCCIVLLAPLLTLLNRLFFLPSFPDFCRRVNSQSKCQSTPTPTPTPMPTPMPMPMPIPMKELDSATKVRFQEASIAYTRLAGAIESKRKKKEEAKSRRGGGGGGGVNIESEVSLVPAPWVDCHRDRPPYR